AAPPRRSPSRRDRPAAPRRAHRRNDRSACERRRGRLRDSRSQRSACRLPNVQELAGGLWTWTAPHPAWNDDPSWGPEVRSYALRTDDGVILFDAVAPPEELTREGNVQVVLTAEWHGRDAKHLGAPIRADDLPPQVTGQAAFFPGERTL